jgi:hypothetical protein
MESVGCQPDWAVDFGCRGKPWDLSWREDIPRTLGQMKLRAAYGYPGIVASTSQRWKTPAAEGFSRSLPLQLCDTDANQAFYF